jgi:predicted TIM-barrel fold metal-dependent hydrolase
LASKSDFLRILTGSTEGQGVRRIVQDSRIGFVSTWIRPGTQLLAEFDLSADICCNFKRGTLCRLVRRCPETSFILDHPRSQYRGAGLNPGPVKLPFGVAS